MKYILLVWARELCEGVVERKKGKVTEYYSYFGLAESTKELEERLGERRCHKGFSNWHVTLANIAEYVKDEVIPEFRNPEHHEVTIDTPTELCFRGFIVSSSYVDRRLSDEELNRLQEECIKKAIIPVDLSDY